jgi:WD40 repeat protein
MCYGSINNSEAAALGNWGKYLAETCSSSNGQSSVEVYDVLTKSHKFTIPVNPWNSASIKFSPFGKTLVVSYHGVSLFWDVELEKLLYATTGGFSPDISQSLVIIEDDDTYSIYAHGFSGLGLIASIYRFAHFSGKLLTHILSFSTDEEYILGYDGFKVNGANNPSSIRAWRKVRDPWSYSSYTYFDACTAENVHEGDVDIKSGGDLYITRDLKNKEVKIWKFPCTLIETVSAQDLHAKDWIRAGLSNSGEFMYFTTEMGTSINKVK